MGSSDLYLKIRELCSLSGLSQAELARRVGMQPSHLNIFLQGRGELQSHRLVNLLFELGIDVDAAVVKAIEGKKRRSRQPKTKRDLHDFIAPLSRLAHSEAEAIYLIAREISQDRKRATVRARRA